MFPFSYTGLRLVHDEKVHEAMERACVDAELAHHSRRSGWLSLPGRLLRRVHHKSSVFATPHSRVISSRPR